MKSLMEFDHQKGTQTINVFAQKEGNVIDRMKVIKLIWLADRYHLRKYGRPIVNDTYFAMTFGPVGSAVKDIAADSDFLGPEERTYSRKYLKSNTKEHEVKSIKEPDMNVFSQSDMEALEKVYSTYGKLPPMKLKEISHAYPEWKRFEKLLVSKNTTRGNMNYLDFFKNPEKGIKVPVDIFKEPHEVLQMSKEIFEENYKIASFWL